MSHTNNQKLEPSVVKTCGDQQFQHTAMANHRGTMVAFTMDRTISIDQIGMLDDR